MEQKIKQDIYIGANIRAIRKENKIKQVDLVRLLQLEGVGNEIYVEFDDFQC